MADVHFTFGPCAKRTYTNVGTARRIADLTNRHEKGGKVSPYHCTACHGWHVGHSRRPKDQRRALREKVEL